MRRLHILTKKNMAIINRELEKYLDSVIAEEETLNTYTKLVEDVKCVQCYGKHPLTIQAIENHLRGVVIGVEIYTYNIVKRFFLAPLNIPEDKYYVFADRQTDYIEDACTLDDYYWHTLAWIIYRKNYKETLDRLN